VVHRQFCHSFFSVPPWTIVWVIVHLTPTLQKNQKNIQCLLSPSQLTDPSITVSDHSSPLSSTQSCSFTHYHSLTLTLSTHNSPQPGQNLSCRPRYIGMLSITATVSQPIVLSSPCTILPSPHSKWLPCQVWMIDRLSFYLVNFYLILKTEWKKKIFSNLFFNMHAYRFGKGN